MKIIVAGGGKVGFYLADGLRAHNRVSLIEKDASRAAYIAEALPDVLTIRGDASMLSSLEDAGIRGADVLTAVTGKDEDNLVICQLAKRHFGVIRTVARVSNPKNAEVFRGLGVDTTVSGTSLIIHFVEEDLSSADLRLVMQFRHGDMELVEIVLGENAPAVGRTVAELALPKDAVLVSILREDDALVVRGQTDLHEGDTVIALTRSKSAGRLREVLAGRPRS